jgi:hypothetical protein
MSERDGYEPGVPCWVATIQPDPEAAAAFYGELFELQMVDYSAQYRLGHKRCAPRSRPGPRRRATEGRRLHQYSSCRRNESSDAGARESPSSRPFGARSRIG